MKRNRQKRAPGRSKKAPRRRDPCADLQRLLTPAAAAAAFRGSGCPAITAEKIRQAVRAGAPAHRGRIRLIELAAWLSGRAG